MPFIEVKFGKGTTLIPKAGLSATSKQALSHVIEATLKKKGVSVPVMEKAAAIARQRVAAVAQAYFGAAFQGSMQLVLRSNVAAQWDPDSYANPKHSSFRRKEFVRRGLAHHKTAATFFMPNIHLQKVKLLPRPHEDLLVKLPETIQVKPEASTINQGRGWKKLTERYALRTPKSAMFFHKQTGVDKSARLQFVQAGVALLPKLSNISAFYKGTISFSSGTTEGSKTARFTINYPVMGPKFEFIRKAFVSGMHGTSVTVDTGSLGSKGVDALLRAEQHRPLMRPYASEVGKLYKLALRGIKENYLDPSKKKT